MNRMIYWIGAAAAVLIVGVGLVYFSGTAGPNIGGPPRTAAPTPSAAPTATAEPTSEPTQSPAAAPPLTQSFTSTVHGYSVSYPEGWTAKAATEPWTDGPNSHPWTDHQADHLYDPTLTYDLFLTISSQPIGESTPEDWIAEQMAEWEQCTATEPIAVGEASGLIGSEGCDLVVVTTDGRGYWISLRASQDDPSAVAPFDRAWFEEVLATVQLRPEDAAAPPPTQSFTSTVHGISVSYPEGWIARAATEPWTDCLLCSPVFSEPHVDVVHDPVHVDHLFLRIASQPIGESAPEDWVAAQMAGDDRCTTTEPIIVDGATGLSGGETCDVAVVTTAGRGYYIGLYVDDSPDLVAQYDRAWFDEVLATVQLHPEDAAESGPSPRP